MRGLVEIFTIFDWITPLKGFVQDFKHDKTLLQTNTTTLFFNYGQLLDSGFNAVIVEKLLHQYNIETWGSQITGGEYFFSFARNQEQQALNILTSNGVPIDAR